MRHAAILITILFGTLVAPLAADAATQTVSGTVGALFANSNVAKTGSSSAIVFQLSTQPTATGCSAGTGYFSFSATSVTDEQTRSNMTALLLAAKTAGMTVTVAYDDAGTYCDGGYAVPLTVWLP